ILMDSGDVNVSFKLEHRQKGLLWYSTYKVDFSGTYEFSNPTNEKKTVFLEFLLPAQEAIYDNLELTIGDRDVTHLEPVNSSITESVELDAGSLKRVSVSYQSQGLNDWHYRFGNSVNQVKNFRLHMTTDFDDIDFPQGTMSPGEKKKLDKGWDLTWSYKNLLTGYSIGMTMPKKLNPGPWVSEVTMFAPVSLFLFYFLLFMFTTIKGLKVHPMNYFFIGAAFFSFHLLMAYLVDHLSIELSFLISSIVSIALVVSYMRLVVSNKFAFLEVGISQLIYLVFFSYTFFYEKYTGLVITILCIVTLFVMMQFTGRIDWEDVFRKRSEKKTT
ncbi:MAG: cell envelope integrity protein CreD, partial [Candidatus Obscuribacterales bacterium]|nr:cell envelope integrity protein CreD [Candidatus Obscuribacterales bacterium]